MEKYLLLLFLLLGSVLLWLGVSADPAYISSTERPLRIAVSTSPLSSPIIIADRMGFFSKQQLTVQLLPIKGGNNCFDALMRGDADLATSSETVVMFNSFQRNDFSIISSFAESDNDIKLLTKAASGIQRPEQLLHHHIGIVAGSASEYFMDALLLMHDYPQQLVQRTDIAPNDLADALLVGAVDAISIWEPFAFQLQQQYPQQIYSFKTKGIYNLTFNLLVRREDTTSHLQQHIRVLKALDEAIQYIINEPEKSQQLVSDYLKVSADEVITLWPDYLFRLSLGNTLLSNLQSQSRWAVNADLVKKHTIPDYRLFIDSTALNQVIHKPLVRKE
ncbi:MULTISPECIES: ABC transporter substrate-binding protein [Shewanella]|jgi:NitT/TauT family transport system substrate-binding protein|uniref:NitT/TauT family transport system substrate-binding protein n=1 Tax=Shewanella fodinae TaxID=552357 RepID=A0A4R2FC43_9GAMM|nr:MULTISPECIES: ABC transporter substrate-binding protein [Shewanella]MBO1270207.1 ABC transporter substrate-binding protein [Shewanella sp. 4t3-1-2LB]MCL2905644.1 ABC transporter substrate-binding protein [Shewanella fodinae]TCN81895.1 NitT/TauT family transport system substrate-binding protein [Shewanella fodinae]GGY92600.1 ABC transporter substrate-binding protein [Shewanella fodinae]